jgi:hypothetical protein
LGSVDTNQAIFNGGYIFIAGGSISVGKPDIMSVDVRNIDPLPPGAGWVAPVNGQQNENEKHYDAIAVAKNSAGTKTYAYMYVGNDTDVEHLQVIDVTDPYNIPAPKTDVKNAVYTLPGLLSSGTEGGAIYFYKDKIYVGADVNAGSPGDEFHVINVSSPLSPVEVGSFHLGRNVNKIYVREQGGKTLAFVARSTGTSSEPPLVILDVSKPAAISQIGQFVPTRTGHADGSAITVLGTKAYLGTDGGSDSNFYIVDVSDPTLPNSCSTCHAANAVLPFTEGIKDIAVTGNFAFIATDDNLRVLNIKDQANIKQPTDAPYGVFHENNGFTSVTFDNSKNLVYATTDKNNNIAFYVLYAAEFGFTLSNSGNLSILQGTSGVNTTGITLTYGQAEPVTLTVSGLPANAGYSWSNNPCTPNPTCTVSLTISPTFSTPPTTYPIEISGGSTIANFDLTVNAPAFDYTISDSPDPINLVRAGSAVTETVTVNMTAGGTPQAVSVTPSTLPSGVTVSPTTGTCTPSATAPYNCTISFIYAASGSATIGSQTITLANGPLSKPSNVTLNVNAPAFNYTLVPTQNSFNNVPKGTSITNTFTLNNVTPGSIPNDVTLTFSDSKTGITWTPVTVNHCIPPNSSSCSVSFTFDVLLTAANGVHTITVTGNNPLQTSSFTIKPM